MSVDSESQSQRTLSYKEWDSLVQNAFERYFWVPVQPQDDDRHVIDVRYVNQRGIYKDVHGSSTGWADYQFRPNFAIAMTVVSYLLGPSFHFLVTRY